MSLERQLSNIGFYINAPKEKLDFIDSDIEESILQAIYSFDSNSRLLPLVFTWGEIHGKHLIADKFFNTYNLIKKVKGDSPWVSAFCALLSSCGDRRFNKGVIRSKKAVYLRGQNVDILIKNRGAIEFLKEINILVPLHYYEFQERKIMTPQKLIKINPQYRNRFIYGTNWRSEIITMIEYGFENPHKISKHLNIGYPRVREVFKDYELVKNVG